MSQFDKFPTNSALSHLAVAVAEQFKPLLKHPDSITPLELALIAQQAIERSGAPRMLEALQAIRARVNGEWDNPALLAIGPLGLEAPDILRICERTAQLLAHRACGNQEQDVQNGKIAGYCIVCQTPWPCEFAAKGL